MKTSVETVLAAESAVEVDRPAAVVHLGSRAAMGVVPENNAAAARDLEPPIEALRRGGKDVVSAHRLPELGLAPIGEKVLHPCIDRSTGIRFERLDERAIKVTSAMLHKGVVVEFHQRRPMTKPLL